VALPPDPDEPTRRLPPTRPAEPIREREVVTGPDYEAWYAELLDRLRSLRTAVALLSILSVAALGVALWALLSQEEEGDARRGASSERVGELEDRIEELESDVGDAASSDAVDRLRDDQEQLADEVRSVRERAGGGTSDAAVQDLQDDITQLGDGVEQLSGSVQDLEQRVDELEQQQAEGGASP
jgi:chromosome segregation ATPase